MSLIKKGKNELAIIHKDLPKVPKPFERDIYLFTTHIAGTSYIENIAEILEKMAPDEVLEFYREPKNSYDEYAIVVKTKRKEKLGYIPRIDNPVFARLLDAGKLLFGKVKSTEKKGNWHKIEIDIYLKD
ncbi:MAG: HIRAN domain-containing protein [Bacilli bacterium]|jgi:hypothetical protein